MHKSAQMSEFTEFRDQNGSYVFVCAEAPYALPVPDACIIRSPLLAHICEHCDVLNGTLLRIPNAYIRAWHRCVRVRLCDAQHLAARCSFEALSMAWQAAELLHDTDVQQSTSEALSLMLVPARVRMSGVKAWIHKAPTQADQDKACKIVRAIPVQCLLNTLKSIKPQSEHHPQSDQTVSGEHEAILCYLLLLLPPSCHSAILYSQCTGLTTSGNLEIPQLPFHRALDDSCHMHASLSISMIAAACPFSRGNPAAIWNPAAGHVPDVWSQFPTGSFPTCQLRYRSRPSSSIPPPSEEGALDLAPALTDGDGPRAPVTSPTELKRLCLDLTNAWPLLWCAAVEQLGTLQQLHISVFSFKRIDPAALERMLRRMPRLECLTIELALWRRQRPESPPGVMSSGVLRLFAGLSGGTHLSGLTLKGCFTSSTVDGAWSDVPAAMHLNLASFAALRSLSLSGCTVQPHWVAFAADILLNLRIVELDVSETHAGGAAAMRARLGGGLTHLQRLNMAGTHCDWLRAFSTCAGFSGVFVGVRWLSLRGAAVGAAAAPHLMRCIQHQQQLEHLDLHGTGLSDSGAADLAGVLRALVRVTKLELGDNGFSDWGVFAILEAAGEAHRRGASLRCLGLAGAAVDAWQMQRYWELLVALPDLEALDVSGALQAVVGHCLTPEGLGGLQKLTRLVAVAPSDLVFVAALSQLSGLPRLREIEMGPRDQLNWDMISQTVARRLPGVTAVSHFGQVW